MATLTVTDSTATNRLGHSIPEIPRFSFSKTRWSTTRQEDVGKTAEFWSDNPTAVKIFEDPKFESHPLLMMRKDAFERLYSVVQHAVNGQKEIFVDFNVLSQQTIALEKFIESTDEASSFNQGVRHLVHAITECVGKIRATFVVKALPKPSAGAPLTAEEIAEIEADED